MISPPSPAADNRLWPCNKIQSRVVTCLLTGYDILRAHLYIRGLIDNTLCRRCGAEKETSGHVLSECEVLATLRHTTGC